MRFSRPVFMFASVVGALLVACGDDSSTETTGDPSGDQDGDGISDAVEGVEEDRNTDGDGFPDYLDLDSDGDGIPDATEAGDDDLASAPVDTDGDGTPDYVDLDSDEDGIEDTDELSPSFEVVDTDSDGTPDHLDKDSDGDTIADLHETNGDRNNDEVPNFRDLDSDSDGISDDLEAGDADVDTAPVDTDSDLTPDFLDLDSDGDFLTDEEEDPNGNGIVDEGESSAVSSDTDGDGTPDLVEVIAGSDPNDSTVNIPSGDFYFVLPYMGPGANGEIDFTTGVQQADIFISMDTTGSFGEEIDAIQAALESTIVPGIAAIIPNAAFGVGRFEDLPYQPFGCPGDRPYELIQPITSDVPTVAAALALLPPANCGLDTPESGYEALYQWASGAGIPEFGLPPFAPPGIGGVGFRENSLPIIIQITDARSHDAADYAGITSAVHDRDAVVAAMGAISARVIGIDSLENEGTANDPRAQLEDLALATKAYVPPDANGMCLTGVGGAPRAPVDLAGTLVCPVVYDILPNGSGLGASIVDAVAQLTSLGVLDISTKTIGQLEGLQNEVLTTGFTTADFIKAVTPVPPAPAGATIDGLVFRDVVPGSTVTFAVDGFNDFQLPTEADQLFAADIDVLGDAVAVLDVRTVYIIVPKAPPEVPQ